MIREIIFHTVGLSTNLFHSDLRFHDYVQYRADGGFPVRFKKWLENVSNDRDKKILFKMMQLLIFIDRLQMVSHRDAFRRIIAPWVTLDSVIAKDLLSDDYELKIRSQLTKYSLYSVTESFSFPEFLHVNDLSGLRKPVILGEDPKKVKLLLPGLDKPIKGIIILEDFVGTGKQAQGVLNEVKLHISSAWRILFLPLIILEAGLERLIDDSKLRSISIEPVLCIRNTSCVKKELGLGERSEFKYIRGLVKSTSHRVLQRMGELDNPPKDPFGYGGSGALLVTCHNTPNNTLPLIHHRSPDWSPLFRRVHHSKDGLR